MGTLGGELTWANQYNHVLGNVVGRKSFAGPWYASWLCHFSSFIIFHGFVACESRESLYSDIAKSGTAVVEIEVLCWDLCDGS